MTVLVTGASSGIGLELARIHASKGDSLVLVARRGEVLQKLKAKLENQYKISVFVIEKDLSNVGAASEIYNELKKQSIYVDVLINNAGFGDYNYFADADVDKLTAMLQLNVIALTQLTKLLLPYMLDAKAGRVMNVASVAGFMPGPKMAGYYASKAYVLHFSEALAEELNGTGITVTALCPGATESGFQALAGADSSALFKERVLPSSQDVAAYGYNAMMKGQRVAIHGLKNRLLVFLLRLTPRKLVTRIISQIQ